ncbi:hypothetical protein BGX29_008625 [Mortierella sp. GBA35]|nr:hypothetical protein BGX29_008625 [Mortierella sp. GBA35]
MSEPAIRLEHIVAQPRVCSKIRCLELVIGLGPLWGFLVPERLESFYHQIGALECLEFKTPSYDLLRRPGAGHLSSLAGLTRLRELRGTVSAMTEEATKMMGWRKAEWFAENLSSLESAEFFPHDAELRSPFAWLQQQRPKLNMRY